MEAMGLTLVRAAAVAEGEIAALRGPRLTKKILALLPCSGLVLGADGGGETGRGRGAMIVVASRLLPDLDLFQAAATCCDGFEGVWRGGAGGGGHG